MMTPATAMDQRLVSEVEVEEFAIGVRFRALLPVLQTAEMQFRFNSVLSAASPISGEVYLLVKAPSPGGLIES